MRVVGNIPHEKYHITIFAWNEKTIIKIEAGPMEQVYKFPENQISGVEGALKLLSDSFYTKIHARFNQMYLDMQEELKNL